MLVNPLLLQEVTQDWIKKRLVDACVLIKDGTHGTHPRVESGILLLSAKNISENGEVIWNDEDSNISEFEYNKIHRTYKLEVSDLLITIVGSLGRRALVKPKILFTIQRSVAVVRCNRELVTPRYLYHFTGTDYFQKQLVLRSNATAQAGLYLGELENTEITFPSLPEQQRIAEILDTIDRAIARTESLIQKLKQIKAGLLHDLLTCGLDENGKLRNPTKYPEQFKDSPLGRIPREWDVLPVGSCLKKIEQGWSPNCESSSTPIGKWGVLKTTAVVWEGYQDSENKLLPEHLKPSTAYEVKPRDVLMTRAGPNSRVGVVVFVKNTQVKLILSDKLYRLVPQNVIQPKFLAYALSSNQTQSYLSTLKTGLAESQTNISQDIVCALWVYLPKIEEQNKIIKILDTYDTRIQQEEAYRDKLKLQKKGLMHDLLTGKVRVKDIVLAES